jgi:hypothetical protein
MVRSHLKGESRVDYKEAKDALFLGSERVG